jgi:diguanylate cyclase (GGDEF)-like protein/PAS domain S-box-containing protein
MKSKLAIAITSGGWFFPVLWLIIQNMEDQGYAMDEWYAQTFMIAAIPFVATFLGYLVNKREETYTSAKDPHHSIDPFKQTLETMQLGVTITDLQGIIIYSNPADAEMHGYTAEELTGKYASLFAPVEMSCPMPAEKIQSMKRWRRESINRRKDGSTFPVMLMSDVITDPQGNAVGLITTCEDITPRKEFEAKIINLAHYDTLTTLPNRYLFHDRLSQATASANRYKRIMAVLFVDLDHFKKINDTFGHGMGDKLLRKVADRLTGCVRSSDSVARVNKDLTGNVVARFGGDEFTVLLSEVTSQEDITGIAQRILDHLARPLRIDELELFIGASIGIALFPRDGNDVDTLLRKADMAMFHAKESGRNNFHFYSDSMSDTKSERFSIESDLRKALQRREFQLYYQPQVDIRTGKISGVEALLRWVRSDSVVAPKAFLEIAEETGLIAPIGDWVIRTACEQGKRWREAGFDPMTVTVNISGIHFRQDGFVSSVSQILRDADLDPGHLQLELAETALIQGIEDALLKLGELRVMGVGLSIDDFGTGYSSLNYLKRFPLTTLKIDRSFIRDVTIDNRSAAITKSIITLGRGLNLKVVAEGVETRAQAAFLYENSCDRMQGFLISEPLDAARTTDFLRKDNAFPAR